MGLAGGGGRSSYERFRTSGGWQADARRKTASPGEPASGRGSGLILR